MVRTYLFVSMKFEKDNGALPRICFADFYLVSIGTKYMLSKVYLSVRKDNDYL